MTDLEQAFAALTEKQRRVSTSFAYYDGEHGLVYSTRRLREVWRDLDAKFVQNWCAVVIDALIDRITLTSLAVGDDDALTAELAGLYQSSGLIHDVRDAHLAVSVTGEGFVIAWPGDDGQIEAYYNDPRLCHVAYDQDNPRRKAWAAKWWQSDGGTRLNLYYPDRIEHYVSQRKASDTASASGFTLDTVDANPYGEIPVFHFRLSRRRIIGELATIRPLQDAINKLLADTMIAAEFGAFRQRYIISQAGVQGALKNAPNEIWDLPAGDGTGQGTQVGEFGQTDLTGYQGMMDKLAQSIAIISRTPRHYLMAQGGDPSGEALLTMESPLTKRANQFITAVYPTWQELGAFLLRLAGRTVSAVMIVPQFERIEAISPMAQAAIRKTAVEAGVPLVTAVRDEGWTQAEIDQMLADKQAEASIAQTSLATALLAQQRQFDQGQGVVGA